MRPPVRSPAPASREPTDAELNARDAFEEKAGQFESDGYDRAEAERLARQSLQRPPPRGR